MYRDLYRVDKRNSSVIFMPREESNCSRVLLCFFHGSFRYQRARVGSDDHFIFHGNRGTVHASESASIDRRLAWIFR